VLEGELSLEHEHHKGMRLLPCEQHFKTFGNPVLTGFTAPRLLWLRTNEPEAFARIARFCLPKDYLAPRLTFAYLVPDAGRQPGKRGQESPGR